MSFCAQHVTSPKSSSVSSLYFRILVFPADWIWILEAFSKRIVLFNDQWNSTYLLTVPVSTSHCNTTVSCTAAKIVCFSKPFWQKGASKKQKNFNFGCFVRENFEFYFADYGEIDIIKNLYLAVFETKRNYEHVVRLRIQIFASEKKFAK